MAREWTDEQLKAIDNPANILVNAAAGSGKTAVLTERIIRKLIPDESGNYTDITNLLVVTFARDAAGEMQDRIKKALSEYMTSAPTPELKTHYKNQLRLVNQSDITTIDSFCIKAVRSNFHLLGIEPSFSVMDKTEADLLKAELAEEFCDSLYEDERFLLLNKLYSGLGDNYNLIKMLIEIHNFTRSLPWPDSWLDECAARYKEPFSGSIWEQGAIKEKNKAFENAKSIFSVAESLIKDFEKQNECEFPENDSLYIALKTGKSICSALKSADYNKTVEILTTLPHIPEKTKKRDEFSKFSSSLTDVISSACDELYKLSEYFPFTTDKQDEVLKEQYLIIKALTELSKEFDALIFDRKTEKNQYEFNDLEHLCLKLFENNPEVREEYRLKYAEILMDEYQDTNALQEAIFSSISKEDNRFMVGDMKQSIYRFRSSDPAIFKNKDKTFRDNPQLGNCVYLTKNFRSRSEVLESVNCLFKSIMHEETGEIEYNDSQRLNCGNTDLDKNKYEGNTYTSEFHVIDLPSDTAEDGDEVDDLTKTTAEARYIANQIQSLMKSDFYVLQDGVHRKLRYSDIAILSTSVKNIGPDYLKTLSKSGIPAVSEGGLLFDRSEIKLVCCLISIICNPLQDIPLISVLRSPLFSFTEDELAKIRISSGGNFYPALKHYANTSGDSKCISFINRLTEWRKLSKYTSPCKLLWILFSQTGLYDMAGILYDEDACANLRLFTEMAKDYEKTGYKGLYSFSCYTDKLRKNNVEIQSVSTQKKSDCVRIMTIHKSKGLEFPVVFIAGAGKQFSNDKASLVMHKDYGIALRYINYETRKTADTVWALVLKNIKSAEALAENMRKLYVAMTRPKEKLIITTVAGPFKYDVNGNYKGGGSTALINAWQGKASCESNKILSAKSYADWIGPCILAEKDNADPLWKLICDVSSPAESISKTATVDKEYTDCITDADINSVLSRKYLFSDETDIPSRMYVTQLKNTDAESFRLPDLIKRPDFSSQATLSGAQIGTAYHTVLSVIDVKSVTDILSIQAELDRICTQGYILKHEKEKINPEKIFAFFESDFGKRLKSSELNRETPFEIMVSSEEVFPGTNGEILIQGIIDCWFYNENGDIVLIDYKTDNVTNPEDLAEKYKNQIYWYKKALEQILNKKVAECYIYSFSKDTVVPVS